MATFADGGFQPDVEMSTDKSLRMRQSQYGDGYKQTTLDGANPMAVEYRVSFSNRPRYLVMQMSNYLEAAQGGAFPFKDPATGETVQVQCTEWSIQWQAVRRGTHDAFGSLSATFTKFYGLWVQ